MSSVENHARRWRCRPTVKWIHEGIACDRSGRSAGGYKGRVSQVLLEPADICGPPQKTGLLTSSEGMVYTRLIAAHGMLYCLVCRKVYGVRRSCPGCPSVAGPRERAGTRRLRHEGEPPNGDKTDLLRPQHWTFLSTASKYPRPRQSSLFPRSCPYMRCRS